MRLVSITIKNFRCYRDEVNIPIGELTTFVGKNDIGKSTVLEALEIFFNNEVVCIEQRDANVFSESSDVEVTCEFSDLPDSGRLTLDAGAITTFQDEYLLTAEGTLRIKKVFDCAKSKPSVEVFVTAMHPTAEGFSGLLELKEKDLQARIKAAGISVALKGNPGMRAALWRSCPDLKLAKTDVPISKGKEDAKRVWDQIESHLPMFALFQSDRSSRDSDDEVQNPMRAAVSAAIAEVQEDIYRIQQRVQAKAEEIARRTHEALNDIDPSLAATLVPEFISPSASKWTGLFSVGLNTEDGIPLNKRGGGVRRLVLVSFFKAEAERRLSTSSKRGIIYAIEEPETAQHPDNQRALIAAFRSLAAEPGCQIILTTHSPGFAAELPQESIRYVSRAAGVARIDVGVEIFGVVSGALGVMPDSRVKVLLCVEGPTDVQALKALSRALSEDDDRIPCLENNDSVAFVVLSGGNLKHWVDEHYLRPLNKPEVHIYDGDVENYAAKADAVNARDDGSWAVRTSKHELESYLHADAIRAAFGVDVEVTDHPVDGKATPKRFAEAFSAAKNLDGVLKDGKAKMKLAEHAFPKMTATMIRERDPEGEIEGWLRRIGAMIR